ncbi:MAG: GNAT family N-acetyltransferase [Candidatus Promineofilum sp.]|jgi:GNAT superfamily N-acetyltransferase|nr:GNAT family N-acetyltransferase [Promineifilum sp.]
MTPTADISIRPATPDDAPHLAALVRALERFDHLREEPLPEAIARIGAALAGAAEGGERSLYVAAGAAGDLLGYVAVHWLPYLILRGPEGFVSELFIAPEARGRGIGSRLLAAAVEEARARGCSRLGLLNNRRRESYERGFYTQHGWQERGDMANFVLYLA